jgi:hypothetical protein
MKNTTYAYAYVYGDEEYGVTYHTDETGRLLYLVIGSLIDFDEDTEVNAKRHSDLFNIITRTTIGKVVSDISLDEIETVGDYDVLNTYSGNYYAASIRHTDTY